MGNIDLVVEQLPKMVAMAIGVAAVLSFIVRYAVKRIDGPIPTAGYEKSVGAVDAIRWEELIKAERQVMSVAAEAFRISARNQVLASRERRLSEMLSQGNFAALTNAIADRALEARQYSGAPILDYIDAPHGRELLLRLIRLARRRRNTDASTEAEIFAFLLIGTSQLVRRELTDAMRSFERARNRLKPAYGLSTTDEQAELQHLVKLLIEQVQKATLSERANHLQGS